MRGGLRLLMLAALCLVVICTGAMSTVARADSNVVVIQFDEYNPPYMFGQGQGVYPALIVAAFDRMGVDVDMRGVPWRRAVAEVDSLGYGIGGAYMYDARHETWDFSMSLLTEELVLITKRGSDVMPKTLHDLDGMYVGVLNGWSYGIGFDQRRKEGFFIGDEVATDAQNLQKLLLGRIDVVIADRLSASLVAERLKIRDRLSVGGAPFLKRSSHLAFSRASGQSELLERFDRAFSAVQSSREYANILQRIVDRYRQEVM